MLPIAAGPPIGLIRQGHIGGYGASHCGRAKPWHSRRVRKKVFL